MKKERRLKNMKKIDGLTIAEVGGIILTVIVGAFTSIVSSKKNERTLQRLVDEKFNK